MKTVWPCMMAQSWFHFERALKRGVIVFDGGVVTYLYEKGVFINTCFDELNLTALDLVQAVHQDYIKAGADVIETNTFGANLFRLAPHGLGNQIVEINTKGAVLAKNVAAGKALVAGSVDIEWEPCQAPFPKVSSSSSFPAFSCLIQVKRCQKVHP